MIPFPDYPFFIRVRFRGISEMVSLDWKDISFSSFKTASKLRWRNIFIDRLFETQLHLIQFSVVKKFGIKISDGSKFTFKLTDNKGTPIPTNDDFIGIVKTFHSSDFSLVVEYEFTEFKHNPKLVTPMVYFKLLLLKFPVFNLPVICFRWLKTTFGKKVPKSVWYSKGIWHLTKEQTS